MTSHKKLRTQIKRYRTGIKKTHFQRTLPEEAALIIIDGSGVDIIENLLDEIDQLRAALEPFAKVGEVEKGCSPDETYISCGSLDGKHYSLTCGDFQRAAKLLKKGRK